MQKKPIRKAKGGDPMRDLRVTGEMWNLSVIEDRAPRNLPFPVSQQPCASLMARFPPSIPLAFFWSCPQAPYLVFFNYKLGSFCSRPGICGLLWDFTVLTSSFRFSVKYFTGNRRQFCNKGSEAAHGMWTGIRGWAQIHRSWLCPHLPTTISLTKFTFSISPYAKRKLLSESCCVSWESQGDCRQHLSLSLAEKLVGAEEGGQSGEGSPRFVLWPSKYK